MVFPSRSLCLILAGCATTIGFDSSMATAESSSHDCLPTVSLDKTIWQVIDAMIGQMPFAKDRVEGALNIELHVDSSEKFVIQPITFTPCVGGPVRLADGVVIKSVDLRISNREGDPGFLVLNFEGRCIDRDELRDHYGDLEMTDHPRGHSLNEKTVYSAFLAWGKLNVGFAERNRGCLSGVSFEPTKVTMATGS